MGRACRRVYDSMNILSVTPMSKVQMLLKHPDFVKTVGYADDEHEAHGVDGGLGVDDGILLQLVDFHIRETVVDHFLGVF